MLVVRLGNLAAVVMMIRFGLQRWHRYKKQSVFATVIARRRLGIVAAAQLERVGAVVQMIARRYGIVVRFLLLDRVIWQRGRRLRLVNELALFHVVKLECQLCYLVALLFELLFHLGYRLVFGLAFRFELLLERLDSFL